MKKHWKLILIPAILAFALIGISQADVWIDRHPERVTAWRIETQAPLFDVLFIGDVETNNVSMLGCVVAILDDGAYDRSMLALRKNLATLVRDDHKLVSIAYTAYAEQEGIYILLYVENILPEELKENPSLPGYLIPAVNNPLDEKYALWPGTIEPYVYLGCGLLGAAVSVPIVVGIIRLIEWLKSSRSSRKK